MISTYGMRDNDHNYCRNPDESPGGAWCYTTWDNTRWEYCPVPYCENEDDHRKFIPIERV